MNKLVIRTENEVALNNMILDIIPRCPDCNLISSLNLYYKEGKPIIHYNCENNHNGDISLEEYLQKYNNHSLLKQKCEVCYKTQNEIKDNYFYYCKCNKFLCHSCILTHPNNEKHNEINIKRYDSFCKIHSNFFSFYCIECKRNICIYCKPQHKSHDTIDLSDFKYFKESKNKIEEQIKSIEKKIVDLDKIKEEINSEIDKIKKSSELEMKFYKILIYTYQYEESLSNINYNIIQNLINFEEIFGSNSIKIYEKIFIEGMKYISFLKNIKNNNQSNPFNINIIF